MKRFFLQMFVFGLFTFFGIALVPAQDIGNLPGIGSGTGTGSGSGIGSGSGGSSSSGSGGSSSSSSSSDSGLGTTVDTPTFQGFEELGSQNFVGVNNSSSFVGVDDVYADKRSTSRTTASSSRGTTTRRTTSRTSAGRTSLGRTGTNQSSGGREVRAAASVDFGFSPMEVDRRRTSFRMRMARLPNFQVVPDRIGIEIADTPQGSVATLTGTVATERDRKLVRQLLLLEPGIDKVDNRLVVSSEAGTSTSVPDLDPGAVK